MANTYSTPLSKASYPQASHTFVEVIKDRTGIPTQCPKILVGKTYYFVVRVIRGRYESLSFDTTTLMKVEAFGKSYFSAHKKYAETCPNLQGKKILYVNKEGVHYEDDTCARNMDVFVKAEASIEYLKASGHFDWQQPVLQLEQQLDSLKLADQYKQTIPSFLDDIAKASGHTTPYTVQHVKDFLLQYTQDKVSAACEINSILISEPKKREQLRNSYRKWSKQFSKSAQAIQSMKELFQDGFLTTKHLWVTMVRIMQPLEYRRLPDEETTSKIEHSSLLQSMCSSTRSMHADMPGNTETTTMDDNARATSFCPIVPTAEQDRSSPASDKENISERLEADLKDDRKCSRSSPLETFGEAVVTDLPDDSAGLRTTSNSPKVSTELLASSQQEDLERISARDSQGENGSRLPTVSNEMGDGLRPDSRASSGISRASSGVIPLEKLFDNTQTSEQTPRRPMLKGLQPEVHDGKLTTSFPSFKQQDFSIRGNLYLDLKEAASRTDEPQSQLSVKAIQDACASTLYKLQRNTDVNNYSLVEYQVIRKVIHMQEATGGVGLLMHESRYQRLIQILMRYELFNLNTN